MVKFQPIMINQYCLEKLQNEGLNTLSTDEFATESMAVRMWAYGH
jgi:hypothetical protein